ncbi:hypothetical protein CC1G_12953 [Coprinopsis cinerea okayama7|uniref:Uncharacterized protein n=1 Tax=Coprinopsis cinerea (strain Okayama-7 / 130 / ATCC MYA-4618 / FGSC 9003) TaxID=240176 RepID=A8P074_COPC7|nr:hypothetical protein CC1G_12953 [Coprinopsis cinerea okayama7\|eukprot:XP_001837830.1 hypothetical protein CC1G_12953 [Coprinopsis cinerea okayama7\
MPKAKSTPSSSGKRRKPRKSSQCKRTPALSDDDGPLGWTHIRDAQNKSRKEASHASSITWDLRHAFQTLLLELQLHGGDCECYIKLTEICKKHEDSFNAQADSLRGSLETIQTEIEFAGWHLGMLMPKA